jgi:hypothetical protein
MPKLFEHLSDNKRREARVLADFVNIYCRENHLVTPKKAFTIPDEDLQTGLNGINLCEDCTRLLKHGIAKLCQCPYEPKPSCRKCKTHCYAPGYREKIRIVMRFSGTYLLKHGRLDILVHLLK